MTYSHRMPIFIADTEVMVEFEFTCSPDIPEEGPSFSSGGQPAERGELEITSATLLIGDQRITTPAWLDAILAADDSVMDELRDSVADDDEGPDPDAERDARRDEG